MKWKKLERREKKVRERNQIKILARRTNGEDDEEEGREMNAS